MSKAFFTSKPMEFYSKCLKEQPDMWQQVIANNGEYITEENVAVLYSLKKKKIIRKLINRNENCL